MKRDEMIQKGWKKDEKYQFLSLKIFFNSDDSSNSECSEAHFGEMSVVRTVIRKNDESS